jgi:uncharacterized membrane protein
MTTHPLYSKAVIKGHPIHPSLVAFPIAFYTGGVASLIVYTANGDPFWLRGSLMLLVAGIVMAVIAAVFGAIDLFGGVPRESAARRTGLLHAGLNVLNLVLFSAAAATLYTRWMRWPGEGTIKVGGPLALGLLGLIALLAAGALGWKLVQTHHVGVDNGPIDRREVATVDVIAPFIGGVGAPPR